MKIVPFPAGKILFLACLSISMVGCAFYPTPEQRPTYTLTTSTSNTIQFVTPTRPTSPTPTPTRTQFPTLPEEEALEAIRNLISTNGDCKLPCVWGITPGETLWSEVNASLMTLGPEVQTEGPDTVYRHSLAYTAVTYHLSFQIPEEPYVEGISIYTLKQRISNTPIEGGTGGELIDITDEIVSMIAIGVDSPNELFLLYNLLLDYGKPQEVFINTYANLPGGNLPFTLAIYYPEQYFLAIYDLTAQNQGGKLIGCPQKTNPFLFTWSPDESDLITNQRILEWVEGYGNPVYDTKTLSEATDMNIETLYNTFKNPNNALCIETPEEYWPFH